MADDDGALFADVVLTAAAGEACAAVMGGFDCGGGGAVPGGVDFVVLRDEVAVGGFGGFDFVAEPFGDFVDGDAFGDEEGGEGAAQVVESEAGEVEFCEVGVESLSEVGAVNGAAVFLFRAKHEGGGESVGVDEEGAEFVGEGDCAPFAILWDEGGGGVDVDEAEGEIKP